MLVQDVKKIRKRLFNTFLRDGLRTKEDLLFYVSEFLGFDIPVKRVCPGHNSPFRFLHDCFFEEVGNSFVLGSRGSGKTRLFSVINHLDMLFKPRVKIVSAGATLDQSHRCYDYVQEYARDPLVASTLKESLMSYSEGTNGSTLEIITGSVKGFNGPHPEKARIDEVELLKWTVLQEGLSMSLASSQYRAQTVMASTRKWTSGSVARLLKEAPQRGISCFNFCSMEAVQQCDRECHGDKTWGDCPAFHTMTGDGEYVKLCGGKAHSSRGWMPIESFIEKCLLLDRDVLLSQWLNRGVSDSSMVYPDWNPEVHVLTWEEFKYKTGHDWPSSSWRRIGAMDFGSRFAFGRFAIDPEGNWYLYQEYFWDGDADGPRLLRQHAEHIKDSKDFGLEKAVFYDPSGLQESLELRSYGISGLTMANNDVLLGLDAVRAVLQRDFRTGRPKFYVLEDCEEAIEEFSLYGHPLGDDGLPCRDAIIKSRDHMMDVVRYAIFSEKQSFASYTTRRAAGLW